MLTTEVAVDLDELSQTLAALGSAPRLRIVASLLAEPTHVSELARRLAMSRPLLYAHLNRLEAVGLVASRLELTDEGHAKKHYWVTEFGFDITPETIRQTTEHDKKES